MTRHAPLVRQLGLASVGALVALSGLAVAGPALAAGSGHPLPGVGAAPARHAAPRLAASPRTSSDQVPSVAKGTVAVADYVSNRVVTIAPDGTETTVPGEWSGPDATAYDSEGDLFVADGFNSRVVEVAPDGTQTTLPTAGLTFVTGLAIDPAGDVYIGDLGANGVYKLATDGTQTLLPFEGLSSPYGIALDRDGNLYATSIGTGEVLEMTPEGVQSTAVSGLSGPSAVAFDAAGDMLVAVGSGVVSVAPDGTQTSLPLSGVASATGVAVDEDGNVIVSDYGTPQTVELTPGGTQNTVSPDAGGWNVAVYGTPKAAQAVAVTSDAPAQAVPGDTYTVSATGGGSENPVTFSADPSSARTCVVTDNGDGTADVDLNRVGDCVIEADEAGDAVYLPGHAEQGVTIRHRQAIAFTSTPQRPQVDGTYQVQATGGDSGNAVTFSLAEGSGSGCAVTRQGQVTFVHATSCVVAADQTGDKGYVPAATAYQQIAIARGDQVVTFTSVPPVKAKVGRTYQPTATGGATGHRVRFSASGACTARDGVVTFVHPGHCYVYANQFGTADYRPGKAHQVITVVKP